MLRALLLAVVASSTNAVGAIATFVVRKGDHKLLARMLGLSTGVMVPTGFWRRLHGKY